MNPCVSDRDRREGRSHAEARAEPAAPRPDRRRRSLRNKVPYLHTHDCSEIAGAPLTGLPFQPKVPRDLLSRMKHFLSPLAPSFAYHLILYVPLVLRQVGTCKTGEPSGRFHAATPQRPRRHRVRHDPTCAPTRFLCTLSLCRTPCPCPVGWQRRARGAGGCSEALKIWKRGWKDWGGSSSISGTSWGIALARAPGGHPEGSREDPLAVAEAQGPSPRDTALSHHSPRTPRAQPRWVKSFLPATERCSRPF